MKKIILVAGVSLGLILPNISATHAALYSPVACKSESFFSANNCDLCYEEKTPIIPGMQLVGLYDTWINPNTTVQHIYEDEQIARPIMINFGGSGTTWTYSEANPLNMWEFTQGVIWTTTGATNRRYAVVAPQGQPMKFIQQKAGTYITLQKTDAKKGEYIGMMKFPLTYRDVSITGIEASPIAHHECVVYRAGEVPVAPTVVTPTPPKTIAQVSSVAVSAPTQKKTQSISAEVSLTPKQITATKTGPELWIAAIIALMLAPMIMFMKKRGI